MSKKNEKLKEGYSSGKAFKYSFAQIADIIAYQSFTFLIFTFYFAVVGINITLISIAFIIWAVWNSINDPLLGSISDRTHTKWGRRLPYIVVFFVPLAVVMYLLFTPPLSVGPINEVGNFYYFLMIILVFELFYTAFSLNLTSLFPEVFMTEQERTKANNVRQIFSIIGLIFAFILPGLIISDFSDPAALPEYQLFGIIAGIIVIVGH